MLIEETKCSQFPLVEEIIYADPIHYFAAMPKNGTIFLDSAKEDGSLGRYSFIGIDPFQMLRCTEGKVYLGDQCFTHNPFSILAEELNKFPLSRMPFLPPFQGGVAGLFGYELGRYLEKLPLGQKNDLKFPDLLLGFFDLVMAFDLLAHRAWVFSSGYPEQGLRRKTRAKKRLAFALNQKHEPYDHTFRPIPANSIFSTFNRNTYELAVKKVIEYIRAGDIFEANISQRFSGRLRSNTSAFDLYCKLRANNPAPFAAYFQWGRHTLLSASPERFLKLVNDNVETRPIKGTRARDREPKKDRELANALLDSEKDRAENIMIVDLMRNDLSRVCLPHSVVVSRLCGLESYASVHHLVSIVEGKLKRGKTAVDLLKASFPGGSITGAPKIRSMEIIASIEPFVRGPYCGSMGYIGFNGDMDLSIIIRTFVLSENHITFQTGGAVTVDSDPASEYEETLIKAAALKALLVL